MSQLVMITGFLLGALIFPTAGLCSDSVPKEIERFTKTIVKSEPQEKKLLALKKWVTTDFIKLRPDAISNQQDALEFGEYELILLDLIDQVTTPSLNQLSDNPKALFDCEYFLLHWQLGLQPQGETLKNKPLKTLKPLIKKFCP